MKNIYGLNVETVDRRKLKRAVRKLFMHDGAARACQYKYEGVQSDVKMYTSFKISRDRDIEWMLSKCSYRVL